MFAAIFQIFFAPMNIIYGLENALSQMQGFRCEMLFEMIIAKAREHLSKLSNCSVERNFEQN